MKIKKLKLANKEWSCALGTIGVLGAIIEDHNVEIHDIDGLLAKNPIKWIPIVIIESIKYADMRLKLNQDIDPGTLTEDIYDTGLNSQVIKDYFKEFWETMFKDVPKEDTKEPKSKKK